MGVLTNMVELKNKMSAAIVTIKDVCIEIPAKQYSLCIFINNIGSSLCNIMHLDTPCVAGAVLQTPPSLMK